MAKLSGTTVAALALALAVGLAAGCGDDPKKKGVPTGTGTGTGTGSGSGSGSEGGGGGTGGATSSGTAGDGGGVGVEDCYDGEDNDQNGSTDCIDGDPACTALCADPCSAPKVIADPGYYFGDNSGFAVVEGTSCVAPVGGGATSVFQVTAAQTGLLEVVLNSPFGNNFTLSLRSTCDDSGSELLCVENVADNEPPGDERASLDVTDGQTVYILVQAHADLWQGAYSLDVRTRVPACGDGILDVGEECDDQNSNPGDGCNPNCELEVTEVEPNDAPPGNAWSAPWVGLIDPAGDSDLVSVNVPGNNYSVLVSTFDLGSGWCPQGKLDSFVVFYDDSFQTLGSDDDSGDGYCSVASARGLSAGTHYVRITKAPKAPADMTFFYFLAIEMDECGNDFVGAAETCDDGNTNDGDGCSSQCQLE